MAVLEKTKPLPGEKVYKEISQEETPTVPDTATQRIRQVSVFYKWNAVQSASHCR